ncbi:MAG: hypothetical protein KDA59_10095, partial [Planctomycetales bacterium]|nr:hypothetical protein [Planctomycetales bacterium]
MEGSETRLSRRERKRLAAQSRPRRWALRLSLLLVVALLLCFAPRLVAISPLRDWAIQRATADLPAEIRVGSVSLGWLSPVVARQIQVDDATGATIAEIDEASVGKPLWRLVLDQSDLGIVRLERPRVQLQLRPDGSNLEDVLAPLMTDDTSSSSSPPRVMVQVTDGELELTEATSGARWSITRCNAEVDLGVTNADAILAKLSGDANPGEAANSGAAPANFAIELNWPLNAAANPPTAAAAIDGADEALPTSDPWPRDARLAIACENWPTEMFTPLLQRYAADMQLGGSLTADSEIVFETGQQQINVRVCEWRNVGLAAPEYLGRDQVRLPSLTVAGRVQRDSTGIEVDQLTLQSEVAEARMHGRIGLEPPMPGRAATFNTLLETSDLEATGEINLARLAAMLPATLHVRDGMQVTSGKLLTSLATRRGGPGPRIEGTLQASDLAATYQNQPLVWPKPLQIEFAARQTANGPVIDRLQGRADFLAIEGSGTLGKGTLAANADLDRLMAELGRFVDLGDTRLAGAVSASLNWDQRDSETNVTGEGRIERFVFSSPGARPWQEQLLQIQFAGRGAAGKNAVTRIDAARLQVMSGDDQLEVELTKPVTQFTADVAWPVRARIVGELERWLARTQTFMPLDGWAIAGQIDAEAAASASARRIQIESSKASVENLRVAGPGLNMQEPRVKGEFVGVWDSGTSRLDSPAAVFQSTALSFRASDVQLQAGGEQPGYQGSASFQGDLGRVANWFRDPLATDQPQYRGTAVGNVQLTYGEGVTQARWQVDVKDFDLLRQRATPKPAGAISVASAAETWESIWSEPAMSVRGDARLNHAADEVDAKLLEVAASAVKARAGGQIRRLSAAPEVSLTGELEYDLAQMAERFRGYLGPDVQLTGSGTRVFRMDGPLWPPEPVGSAAGNLPAANSTAGATPPATVRLVSHELRGHASVGWESAHAFGLDVGNGELKAQLAESAVTVEPLQLAVSQGRLLLQP